MILRGRCFENTRARKKRAVKAAVLPRVHLTRSKFVRNGVREFLRTRANPSISTFRTGRGNRLKFFQRLKEVLRRENVKLGDTFSRNVQLLVWIHLMYACRRNNR